MTLLLLVYVLVWAMRVLASAQVHKWQEGLEGVSWCQQALLPAALEFFLQ